MPIEQATYIKELQPDWPVGSDPESAGDDHLRLIKQAMVNTFPELDAPVTGTPTQLNDLTAHLRYSPADATDPVNIIPEHLAAQSETEEGVVAIQLNVKPGTAQQPDGAINFNTIMEVIYRVGTIITNTGTNPAGYLGFGTWVARTGYIAGVGDKTDFYGKTVALGPGEGAGTWRVGNVCIVGQALPLVMDYVGDHTHAYTRFGSGGNPGNSFSLNDTQYGDIPSGTEGAGGHTPTGQVTIGTGSVTEGDPFTPPYHGVYVWERTE